MALPLIGLDPVGQLDRVVDVAGAIQRHRHRHLLAREGMIRACTGFRHDEEQLAFGDRETRHAGDLLGILRHDLGVDVAIFPYDAL